MSTEEIPDRERLSVESHVSEEYVCPPFICSDIEKISLDLTIELGLVHQSEQAYIGFIHPTRYLQEAPLDVVLKGHA
jgi:hypothetical protein